MNLLLELNQIAQNAFEKAGFDPKYGAVQVSNRPDLCEYQINGALSKEALLTMAEELLPENRVS